MKQAWSVCARWETIRPTGCNSGDTDSVRIRSINEREVVERAAVEKEAGPNVTRVVIEGFSQRFPMEEQFANFQQSASQAKVFLKLRTITCFCSLKR